ncbi:MAG TPA: 2'-5' RNA ligase family protein [Actinomycetota bacterium]|nr:2'-5' RNA ligase family protein [Actinomycetota bacterium]
MSIRNDDTTGRIGVCPECGFDWATPEDALASRLDTITAGFDRAISLVPEHELRERPQPNVWSPLEYAGHARDVLAWFEHRVRRVLDEDRPQLTSVGWSRATDERQYHLEAANQILAGLASAASSLRNLLGSLTSDQWQRVGVGTEGHDRDVVMLARRAVHEAQHHLHDVQRHRSVKTPWDDDPDPSTESHAEIGTENPWAPPMHRSAVVAIEVDFSASVEAAVVGLWSGLRDAGHPSPGGPGPPHVSLAAAIGLSSPDDAGGLRSAVQATLSLAPPSLSFGHVGAFPGEEKVVYLGPKRSPGLIEWHAQVWAAVERFLVDPIDYYRPGRWTPHCTMRSGPGKAVEDTIRWLERHVALPLLVPLGGVALRCYRDGRFEELWRIPISA